MKTQNEKTEKIKRTRSYVIVPAAGMGRRMQAGINKPFLQLNGCSLLATTCSVLADMPEIDGFLIVGQSEELGDLQDLLDKDSVDCSKLLALVAGGQTRQESVYLGLLALADRLAESPWLGRTLVLVHDANRCLVTPGIVRDCLQVIERQRCGAGAGVPVIDTIRIKPTGGHQLETLPDRDQLVAMQTPQGADLEVLLAAHKLAREEGRLATDELSLLDWIGYPIRISKGDPLNIKITLPTDLELAECMQKIQNRRVNCADE